MLVRHVQRPINAFATSALTVSFTCSTGDTASASTGYSDILDRLALGSDGPGIYCVPVVYAYTTVGSTQADKQMKVNVKLQHGASSGGGDMADWSTGAQPATRTYFSTVMSTDMQNWTTGVSGQKFHSNPCAYDLVGANRFVRIAYQFIKNGYTTSTAAGSLDRLYVGGEVAFGQAEFPSADTTSSSTST